MLVASQSFLEPLEQWLTAVRREDFVSARRWAKDLLRSGELLIIHPEFLRCFSQRCPTTEAKECLAHLCAFLMCATDGRAHVLKKLVDDPQPAEDA